LKEKKKKRGEFFRYISPYCRDDPSHPTNTKIGRVSGMDEVINPAKFGVDQLIGAGCVTS
jgi:hypothetical protein